MHRGLMLALAAVTACSAAAALAGPLPVGLWGSQQGNFTVYADSATLDLPCAAGRIPSPIVADSTGAFDLAGSYAPMVGPVPVGGPAWQPAQFHAKRSGDDLTITIILSNGNSIGPFGFHRGTTGQFARCL